MRKYKRPENKYRKPGTGKKWYLAAGASVLAATVAGTSLWHALESAFSVQARESFSGIGKVVENHNEENPFVILDIVPGIAAYNDGYNDIKLSLGTIGYLTGGQSPIEQSLADAFKNDTTGVFFEYSERAAFAETVIPPGMDASFPWISYEEGYASITSGLSASNGWTQILDSYLLSEEKTVDDWAAVWSDYLAGNEPEELHHWGSVYGIATKKNDATTDATGYDYDYMGSNAALLTSRYEDGSERPEFICEEAEDGEYYAAFTYKGAATSGYRAVLVSEDLDSYSDATDVYVLVDGVYHYVGQKKDIFGTDEVEDTESSGNITLPDNKLPDEGNEETKEPEGSDNTDNTDDIENKDKTSIPGSSAPSGGNSASQGNSTESNSDAENTDSDETASLGWLKFSAVISETGTDPVVTENGNDNGSNSGADNNDGGGATGDSNDNGGDNTGDTGDNNDNGNDGNNNGNNNGGNDGNNNGGTGDNNDGGNSGDYNDGNNGDNSSLGNSSDDSDGNNGNSNSGNNADNTGDNTGTTEGNGSYYILTFVYVEGLEEAENLYDLDWYKPKEEMAVGEIAPFITYNISSYIGLMQEDEDAAAFGMRSTDAGEPFVYVGAGKGEYRLEKRVKKDDGNSTDLNADIDADADEDEDIDIVVDNDADAGFQMVIFNAPVYFRCCKANDWLERYVFHSLENDDNASETFDIQVKTVAANEVTLSDVAEADLIYLEAGLGGFLGNDTEKYYITKDSDMSKNVLANIVARAANDLLPVIVDYDVVSDTEHYKDTNYQKLAQIFLKKDLTAFYQDMETVDNMFLNLESSDYPNKTDNHYNYVNRNVYIVNADLPLVAEDFYEPFGKDDTTSGFMEVIAAIKAENSTLDDNDKIPENVSKAKAIQYIINYSVGLISEFRDFSILELQPTSNTQSDLKQDSDAEKDTTVLYWKKADSNKSGQQILRSSKRISISVDTKSVAQFAGELGDINNTYQMIFIGLDGQRLNYDEDNKKTVYNDRNLHGRVYTSVGDIATESEERYEKIDITAQKREALIGFLKAGYPIVVEDDFFVDKTAKDVGSSAINTKYIDDSSQMYHFLTTAVTEYNDCIYTISDVHSSAVFAAQINVRRPQIGFLDEDGNEIGKEGNNIIQKVTADEAGDYRGTIRYRVSDDIGEAYSGDVIMRLYLDMNQDGRFATEEEVDNFSADNGELIVEIETPEKGIIPWKLEVSDAGNGYRRDELTGFFQITFGTLTPVRILQVVDNSAGEGGVSGSADYVLSKAYEDKNLLGHYLRDAEGLSDTQFTIETLTVSELEAKLGENEIYLTGYDVLVLGFGPACHLGGAADAVNQYIAEGRGVLISSAAASDDAIEGRMGLNTSLLGQQNSRTYGRLAEAKGSVAYYLYKDLQADMFGERGGLPAAQINDGIISNYPFEVGADITIARPVRSAEYLLDFSANGTQDSIPADVTAWYCLGNAYASSTENLLAYNVSRMDAMNNYYIYSRGNAVYVGQDSYPYSFDEEAGMEPDETMEGVAECKLFVNALMAAYNVGVKNPRVTIVAGLAEDSSEIESICIPFDEQIKEDTDENAGLLDEKTDLYFKILEPNMAFTKTVEVAFYYQDETNGAEVDIGGKIVHATQFASAIWTVEQNQLVEVEAPSLTPGKIYKIKAPVIPLEDAARTNADIYVVIRTVFNKLGQERTAIGSDSVSLNRAQLFLLE